jgi:CMP-N-acetylneuraminic acid synthetase
MRHHSERVPEKNYRKVAGRPLYEYILDTLLQVPEVEEILVDTDSPVIASGIQDRYPRVRLIDRPPELRDGAIPMNDVIAHDLQFAKAEWLLQTHTTNPLLRPETIRDAMAAFLRGRPGHDSLFTVTRISRRLWTQEGKPLNHDPAVLVRTQDLPPIFEENSCLYLFSREDFLRRRNRIGGTPQLFEIPAEEAVDLDTPDDLVLIEALLRDRGSRAVAPR